MLRTLKDQVKERIVQSTPWRNFRAHQVERHFLSQVRQYGTKPAPSLEEVTRRLRERLGARPVRSHGSVHTFALVPKFSWHMALLPGLERLGPVTHYGFDGDRFLPRHRPKAGWEERRREVNEEILQAIRKAHRERPLDWIFSYSDGQHLLPETLSAIRKELGIPFVLMGLDDKHIWESAGQVSLAPEVDLYWTTARECSSWIETVGGRPVFLPEGCDPSVYRPLDVAKKYDIAFLGASYGFRKSFIRRLKSHGIDVRTFGAGWGPDSFLKTEEDLVRVINESWLVLGHGGVGYSENLLNIKGRDFDVPATGGGAYLTTYHPDLVEAFEPELEVFFFRSDLDLVTQVRKLLSNKELIVSASKAARDRCLREHTWDHRYQFLLKTLGVLA